MNRLTRNVKVWIVAARPHTLSASVVPVIVGSALAARAGEISWIVLGLTLAGSVLVQVAANLTDEYADHDATASKNKFPAPHKVIARGLLTRAQVRRGAMVAFGIATMVGVWLIWRTGWPLLVVCLVSLLVAYAYSAGPFPLGDYALGEALVFVVMGPLMVGATYYVQTGTVGWDVMLLALPVGGLVTAILVANNLRDEEEDRRNGRLTLVTLAGGRFMRIGYLLLVLMAFAVPMGVVANGQAGPWLMLPWLTLPLALRLAGWLRSGDDRGASHKALRGTAALHLLFGLLLSAGIVATGI